VKKTPYEREKAIASVIKGYREEKKNLWSDVPEKRMTTGV